MGIIDSFQGLKKWCIPIILTDDGQIKSLEEWKQGFQEVINVVLTSLEGNPNQGDTFINIIDKIMEVEQMYHNFALGVAVVPSHKTKEAMNKLHSLKGFSWPADEIQALHKKYCSLQEKQLEEED